MGRVVAPDLPERPSREVYVLRGPSGSGKSHFARERFGSRAKIISADTAPIVVEPDATVQQTKRDRRLWCIRRLIDLLDLGDAFRIVIDDRNLYAYDCAVYCDLALAFGASAQIITFTGDPVLFHQRNTRSATLLQIQKQHSILTSETPRILLAERWQHVYASAFRGRRLPPK